MTRVFFRGELEGVATFWRVLRRDGVTHAFTSHDRDLVFDGFRHRSAPGMLPSSIRRTADLELDSAEVQGALSHDSIREEDLAAGRFDGARVVIGAVDWETLEHVSLYSGEIGTISSEGGGFAAELRSAKAALERDVVPRTSPTCRARFCGPGCGLSAHRFTHEARLEAVDEATSRLRFSAGKAYSAFRAGTVRWIDGPHAGLSMRVADTSETAGLLLEADLSDDLAAGRTALLREGCDHTLATCEGRFANSINFQGEPFLPGNDALVRYPTSSS